MVSNVFKKLVDHLGKVSGNPLLALDQRYLRIKWSYGLINNFYRLLMLRSLIKNLEVSDSDKIFILADYIWEVYRIEAIRKLLLRLLNDNTYRVADIGCGTCLFYPYVAMEKREYFGLDIDKKTINRVTRIYKNSEFEVPCLGVGDALNIPLKSNSYDLIILTDVLEHVTKPNGMRLLREIHRVLKDDGFLLLSTDNKFDARVLDNILRKLVHREVYIYDVEVTPAHKASGEYSKNELEKVFEASNFYITEKKVAGIAFWYRLATMPKFIKDIQPLMLLLLQIIEHLVRQIPGLRWRILHSMIYLVKSSKRCEKECQGVSHDHTVLRHIVIDPFR